MMTNDDVADKLREISVLYEAQSDRWRSLAYARATKTLLDLDAPIETIEDLTGLPGIGPSISAVIREILASGTCQRLEDLKAMSPPATIAEFKELPGVGMKTAEKIWRKYGARTMAELGEKISRAEVDDLKLVQGFLATRNRKERLPLEEVLKVVEPLVEEIRAMPGVLKAEVAGSVRRRKELVRDVDIVVCANGRVNEVIDLVKARLGDKGEGREKLTGSVLVGESDRQVDVSMADEKTWGACLMYLTGSKEFNIFCRQRAKDRGMLLNRYGLWIGDDRVAGASEKEVFEKIDLPYVEPEKRTEETAKEMETL